VVGGRVSRVLWTPNGESREFRFTGTGNGRRKEKARIDRVAPIFITKQFVNKISRKVVGIPRDVHKRRNVIILGVEMMAVL